MHAVFLVLSLVPKHVLLPTVFNSTFNVGDFISYVS